MRQSWAWNLVSDTKAVWDTQQPFSWDEPLLLAWWAIQEGGVLPASSQNQ